MALYLVTVAQQLIVQAASGDDAAQVALDNYKQEDGEPSIEVEAELRRVRDLPKAWSGCYPWGGDGELTVDEILDATQEEDARAATAAAVKARHSDMFDETPNVRVDRAPAREARREPNGDAVGRSGRTRGWAAARIARASSQCMPS